MHSRVATLLAWGGLLGLSQSACPYADPSALGKRDDGQSSDFLDKYKVDDSTGYMTSDVGGPIEEQASLKAGIRGSTLLEDFIFRQKIQHFDHERVSAGLRRPMSLSTRMCSGINLVSLGSREGGPCSRCWSPWHLHELRRLEQPHRSVVPECRRKRDAGVCSLLHRCRVERQRRHGERCPRVRNSVVSLPSLRHQSRTAADIL